MSKTTTITGSDRFAQIVFSVSHNADPSGRPPAGGVAQRRRERRLRSMLRHEQETVRMALATALHHSFGKVHAEYGAPLGLKTATRAGEEEHEDEHDAPRRQKPPLPQLELFQLYEEELAGWQERVQRHAVEHLAGLAPPWCKFSMLLCRRWGNSWRTS